MSAYIVSREHIRYLVHAALSIAPWTVHNGTKWCVVDEDHEPEDAARLGLLPVADLGMILWSENFKSVKARYPTDAHELIPDDGMAYAVHKQGLPALTAQDMAQVIMACKCYAYQSCEHEGWETSLAKAVVDSIQAEAIHKIPGMDTAVWGCPADRINA